MRKHIKLILAVTALFFTLGFSLAQADESHHSFQGLYLLADFPAVTVQPGTPSTLSLKLRNENLPPTRLALHIEDVPKGWKATLLGGGRPVAAAMPGTDDNILLQLRLEVPADAASGEAHTLHVVAEGEGRRTSLPVSVSLAKALPAQLTVEPSLPAIKGGASAAFDYSFTVKNDSGHDLTVSLDATTPQYFRPVFTEGYGSQQISSVPIKAGESKNLKLSVHPPADAQPGDYPVSITAAAGDLKTSAALQLQIVGQPTLRVSGRDGLMSANAEAANDTTIPIIVRNTGGAPAENVQLSSSAPSGWQITFNPATIPNIAPNAQTEVQATLTPSARSLAGDYMTDITARTAGESASGSFRITVTTSSTWGIIGIIVIAIAVLILVGAVARYGRR